MRLFKIALIGGGIRETVVANELIKSAYPVSIYGIDKNELISLKPVAPTMEEALEGSSVLVLPVSGADGTGLVHAPAVKETIRLTESIMSLLEEDAPILTGVVSPFLKDLSAATGHPIIPLMERDEIAIPNAIPTAEGAVAIAMDHLPVTIYGSKAAVLGFGRVGKAVAHTLKALGASVTVFSRNGAEHKEGRDCGYDMRYYEACSHVLPHCDLIVNTVPHLILDAEKLSHVLPRTPIIDLASKPGGVDFTEAQRRDITAIIALGLPGKCAPITAGEILARGIRPILDEICVKHQERKV